MFKLKLKLKLKLYDMTWHDMHDMNIIPQKQETHDVSVRSR